MEKYRTANELYEICQTKEAMLNASFEMALKKMRWAAESGQYHYTIMGSDFVDLIMDSNTVKKLQELGYSVDESCSPRYIGVSWNKNNQTKTT